jgi:hypothetical protein
VSFGIGIGPGYYGGGFGYGGGFYGAPAYSCDTYSRFYDPYRCGYPAYPVYPAYSRAYGFGYPYVGRPYYYPRGYAYRGGYSYRNSYGNGFRGGYRGRR